MRIMPKRNAPLRIDISLGINFIPHFSIRVSVSRRKMAFNSRTVTSLRKIFQDQQVDEENDLPSDGEGDNLEALTDSRSEQDALEISSENEDEMEFESEEQDFLRISTPQKRERLRDTDISIKDEVLSENQIKFESEEQNFLRISTPQKQEWPRDTDISIKDEVLSENQIKFESEEQDPLRIPTPQKQERPRDTDISIKNEVLSESEDQMESESEEQDPLRIPKSRKRKRLRDIGTSKRGRKYRIIRGHDGYRWYMSAQKRETPRNRISNFTPGPTGEARNAKTPLQAWSLLFENSLLEKIVLHTNEEIVRFRNSIESFAALDYIYSNLELTELKAFIGLLYFSGLQKTCYTNLQELWSRDYGSAMYRATMSMKRFAFLFKMIRFDDKISRQERRATDKFAPIRELWEGFISNCTKYYTPTSCCTIDEQILSFRERCPFKVHNSLKPRKSGIKFVMLNDSRTYYMYTAEPYAGKVLTESDESVQSYYVRKLSTPLHGTARNLTCDNWFSSIEIFDKMLKNYSLTMVGTLRKTNPQIPNIFKKAGTIASTRFAFDKSKTLVSYVPKRNKVIILLSSLHYSAGIDKEFQLPKILTFYNSTKSGTDVFDQMCQEYSTARKTLRWSMRVWMGILDQAGINAMILYNFNNNNAELVRRDFIQTLVRQLIDPYLYGRLQITNLSQNLKFAIEDILDVKPKFSTHRTRGTRAKCVFCSKSDDRKSRVTCTICQRPVCENHSVLQCITCNERN